MKLIAVSTQAILKWNLLSLAELEAEFYIATAFDVKSNLQVQFIIEEQYLFRRDCTNWRPTPFI